MSSMFNKLAATKAENFQKSQRSSNLLIVVEGFEGTGDKSVLIGKDSNTLKPVRISLRPYTPTGKHDRPTIDAMMSPKDANKVHVGGIVLAESCYQDNADGSELTSSWFKTYQHKPSKVVQQWLMTPPEDRVADETMRLALNGPCNLTIVESSEYKDATGALVKTDPKIFLDYYSVAKAKVATISSMEQLQDFVAEAISTKNKLVEADTRAVIRAVNEERNVSLVLGVPFSRKVRLPDGNYEMEHPSVTAASYIEASLNNPDSLIPGLISGFEQGESVDIEYVPASRFLVTGDTLAKLNVFNKDGEMEKSPEGSKSKTQGERFKSMFLAKVPDQRRPQIRLLETNMSAIFYGSSNKPIVGGLQIVGGYTKGYTLDKLPTENFKPLPEVNKSYSNTAAEQAKPEAGEAKPNAGETKSDKPKETKPDPKVSAAAAAAAEVEMDDDDLDALNDALDGIEMPGM
jgi:hypothetical protein